MVGGEGDNGVITKAGLIQGVNNTPECTVDAGHLGEIITGTVGILLVEVDVRSCQDQGFVSQSVEMWRVDGITSAAQSPGKLWF